MTGQSWQLPGATRVESITNFQDSFADGDEIVVQDMARHVATLSDGEIARVGQRIMAEPMLVGGLIDKAGTVTGSKADDDFEHIAGTVGVAWPGFDVRIVDRVNAAVPAGEPGEVCVRGPTVMRGYLDDPEATADAFDAEGFEDLECGCRDLWSDAVAWDQCGVALGHRPFASLKARLA